MLPVNKRITGVRTSAGAIATERVVNCAGPQAALIAAMIGVDLRSRRYGSKRW